MPLAGAIAINFSAPLFATLISARSTDTSASNPAKPSALRKTGGAAAAWPLAARAQQSDRVRQIGALAAPSSARSRTVCRGPHSV
jgi:hypothetical protein